MQLLTMLCKFVVSCRFILRKYIYFRIPDADTRRGSWIRGEGSLVSSSSVVLQFSNQCAKVFIMLLVIWYRHIHTDKETHIHTYKLTYLNLKPPWIWINVTCLLKVARWPSIRCICIHTYYICSYIPIYKYTHLHNYKHISTYIEFSSIALYGVS